MGLGMGLQHSFRALSILRVSVKEIEYPNTQDSPEMEVILQSSVPPLIMSYVL